MGRCCVPNCRGNDDNGPKVGLFSFPRVVKRRAEWQRAVRRRDVDVGLLKDPKVYRDDERRIKDAPHPRRPRATTAEDDHHIVAAVSLDPFQRARDIKEALDFDVSEMTIRRRFSEAGLKSRMSAQKPLLTDTNKAQRYRFAQDHQEWTVDQWRTVVFSDESTFTTMWDQRLGVWRPDCHRYDPQFIQNVAASGRTMVNVWGALSKDGLGPLFRIEGSLTSQIYCEVIDYVMLPYVLDGHFPDSDFTYQHDLSPVHTSGMVRRLLKERCVTEPPWPPKGADLNIIENNWGRMKAAMARRPLHRATADELWRFVLEV
ncbi:putative transposable element tc1 transposase [Ixodes scapularis]